MPISFATKSPRNVVVLCLAYVAQESNYEWKEKLFES